MNFVKLALVFFTLIPIAGACPLINGIPDFNCDGKLVLSFVGDSFVAGYGDTQNGNQGGYVTRLRKTYPKAQINNFGELGLNSVELISNLTDTFRDGTAEAISYQESDFIGVDLGRNDRWFFGPPSQTLRNLKRIRTILKQNTTQESGVGPLIVQAVLMLVNRGSQGPWVKELDTLILKSHSGASPANLRFDLVSKRLIGEDQIHPTSAGYAALAKSFVAYGKKFLIPRMKALRPDSDKDGIADLFETARFATDPANPDSDGDGVCDGKQLVNPEFVCPVA